MVSRKPVDCSTNFAVDSGGLDVPEPMRCLLQQHAQRRTWHFVYLRGSVLELIGKFSSRHHTKMPPLQRGNPTGEKDGTRDRSANPNLPTE